MWSNKESNAPPWPKTEDGEPVPPVYLDHVSGGPLDVEVALNLLKAYEIPYISELPNNGSFGKMIFGRAPSGMEIYVPETMFEDAQNILNAEPVLEDFEAEGGDF
ncbi:MAG: hypothetical protein FWH17_03515 [Oscillospiraceae bacterium]|nr:hypothetical protein [Oscillospiraceae bacterium]